MRLSGVNSTVGTGTYDNIMSIVFQGRTRKVCRAKGEAEGRGEELHNFHALTLGVVDMLPGETLI